jgi:hypothetical protein
MVCRDDSGVALEADSSLTEAVILATKGLARWAQDRVRPPNKALYVGPPADPLEPT